MRRPGVRAVERRLEKAIATLDRAAKEAHEALVEALSCVRAPPSPETLDEARAEPPPKRHHMSDDARIWANSARIAEISREILRQRTAEPPPTDIESP